MATCEICGRERTAWAPEKTLGAFVVPWAEAAKCWHGNDGASDREHWRLGYEREKARAAQWQAEAAKSLALRDDAREALAAARRECEGLRKALTTIRDECSFMFHRDIPWVRHVAAEALAAPAAGDARVACGDCPPHPAKEDREP